MSNEAIVKKGEQIKAIDIELEDVKQQVEILKAKANALQSDKAQLTKEIVELKHNDNQSVQRPLIKAWIDKMKSKYDNGIEFGYGTENGEELYAICITINANDDEVFYVSKTKSESATKEFLDELEQTIILVNELDAQNVLDELDIEYLYFSQSNNKIFTNIYFDESNKSIRLRLKKDGLIDVHISKSIYEVPQYKVQLINSVYLKPKPFEDGYGNQFKEYSYELTYDRTVNINFAVQGIKSALKNFDETQAKYVKSAK